MKTLSLPHYSSNALLNKVLQFQPGIALSKLAQLTKDKAGKTGEVNQDQRKRAAFKTASHYLSDVIGESFRQNFMGYDINIEFLWLTMQKYGTYFSAPRFSASRKETQPFTHINTNHNEN